MHSISVHCLLDEYVANNSFFGDMHTLVLCHHFSLLEARLRMSNEFSFCRTLSTMSTSHLPATTDSIAQALEAKNPSEAISIYYIILENPSSSPESLRIKEQAITNLSDLLRQENRAEELRSLLTKLRPFFALIPKA